MEGKLNRLYLLTMSDRRYICGKVKEDHRGNNKDILWKQLLKDKGYSYRLSVMLRHSSIQSFINFSQACESYTRISESASQILVSSDYFSE